MRRRWIAAAIIAAATLPLRAQSPSGSDRPSRDWHRLSSASFDVVGNASEGDLRRALDRLDTFRAVLQGVLPRVQLASARRTRV
jgi:hypothetical protein